MQEVFGKATSLTGLSEDLGVDTEWVEALAPLNAAALMPAFPESTTWPARNVSGYAGSTRGVCWGLSPTPATAPEVFFQDNRVRLSIVSGAPVQTVFAAQGIKPLSEMIAKLDRSRPHVLHVRLAGSEFPVFAGVLLLGSARLATPATIRSALFRLPRRSSRMRRSKQV